MAILTEVLHGFLQSLPSTFFKFIITNPVVV